LTKLQEECCPSFNEEFQTPAFREHKEKLPCCPKIAFVGDSFCAEFYPEGDIFYHNRGYKAWTQLLVEHYEATVIQKGISGDCLFHSYQRLIEVIDEADLVIICVSEPDRLANHLLQPMSPWAAERGAGILKDSGHQKTLYKASLDYYKHIFSPDFHMVAHLGILRALDDLLINKNKKSIWFGSFYNSFGDKDDAKLNAITRASLPYVVRSGTQGSCPLIKTSDKTHPHIPHSNHFNEQQSNEFFQYLCGIIDTGLFEPGINQMDFCCVDDDP
tara:strand:- start:127 stop:945 length:819 start_codon:yes stop_codon:yes gene_type:complete